MFLKKIHIHNYKLFKAVEINLEKSDLSDVFSIASVNGGGKSTLLQFIFTLLHCFMDEKKRGYISQLLEGIIPSFDEIETLVDFTVIFDSKKYYLNFLFVPNGFKVSEGDTHISIFSNPFEDFELVIKSDMPTASLQILSKNIFLASPNSQVFHFLKKEDKDLIYSKNSNSSYKNYSEIVEALKKDIKNFFTYDFFSTQIILNIFEKAFKEDRALKLSTGQYGDHFDRLITTLDNSLEGKSISVDADISNFIFKLRDSEILLSPADLSHGELKKLGLFIWLKYFVPKDAIVLMDEIDIALHPSWQYELVDDLEEWSADNTQFFLATHSPQILSSTFYKNLTLLDKKNNNSTVQQLDKPLDNNDVNSVIDLIMGTNHLPKKLDRWHIKYRQLVKNGKEESQNAIEIKKKILEWESINSSFFRRIDFFKKMRK
jgi:ABC-type multidrug transport system ATPase subunit